MFRRTDRTSRTYRSSRTTPRTPAMGVALALLGATLATTTASTLEAQGTSTVSIDATAAVINPISVSVTHAVDFGRMLAGANRTLTPNSATAGRVEVAGQNGSAVSVTLTMPTLMNAAGGGTAIPISSWNYMLSSSATLAGATAMAFDGGTPVAVAATLGGASGVVRLYLGLGASINVPAGAVGNYTGSGNITAAYTDL